MRFLIVIVMIVPAVAESQWITSNDFDARAQRGIHYVYNLEFEKAEEEFAQLSYQYPSHPAGKFFLGMIEWWRILIEIDDESHDDTFIKKMDDVIDLCDSLLDHNNNDITALFFKGGALGFQGRLRANRSSWVKAANDGRRALPIVQKAYAIAPDNYDILLGIGIYNYYAATIPERYPLVKPVMIFFPSGDKQKGIEQLEMASERAHFASIEAKYFLLQLNYNYERKFQRALEISRELFQEFPNNVLFHRYVARSNFVLSQVAEAELLFRQIVERNEKQWRGYGNFALREAHYYLGLLLMQRQQYDEALQHFFECDKLCRLLDSKEQSGFMVLANVRIGMIYDLQKKRRFAVLQYEKVNAMREFENSRDLAKKYLKEPYTQ